MKAVLQVNNYCGSPYLLYAWTEKDGTLQYSLSLHSTPMSLSFLSWAGDLPRTGKGFKNAKTLANWIKWLGGSDVTILEGT
jgi:hypothetical protein